MFASRLSPSRRAAALLLVLIASVLVLDRIGSAIMARVVMRSHNRIAQVYGSKIDADVLILGNSVADAMVRSPLLREETGLKTYMAAVHGLDARTQLEVVKALLARNRAPRFALLEVRSASNRSVIAAEWAMFSRQSPGLITLAEEASPTAIPWRRIFSLYNFNSRNLPSVIGRIAMKSDQAESDANGTINEAKKNSFIRRRGSIAVGPDALTAFVATVRLLQQHGTKVIVVAAPMHPVTRQLGNWATDYARTVEQALPAGTPFFNALTAIQADADFEDAVHMNESGRRKFAPMLAAAMNRAQ